MSSSTSVGSAGKLTFDQRVEEVKPSKSDINFVIMDYLVNEGYPSAAKKFANEANIRSPVEEETIIPRVEICNAIHAGDIETAIHKINDFNPTILDSDPSLHFALLRLQLIELIRTCTISPNSASDLAPALRFASTQLAPRAPTNPQFLEDLERTMALLIFSPDNLSPPLAALLDPALRLTIANRVNEALLSSQGRGREARIKNLVRLRAWAKEKVGRRDDVPDKIDLGLDERENDSGMSSVDESTGNGSIDEMVV